MIAQRRLIGLSLLFVIAGLAYFYRSAFDTDDTSVVDVVNGKLEPTQADSEQLGKGPSGPQLAVNQSNSEMRAELNKLVSTDSVVREKALVGLADEFHATPPRSEGKYTTYGDVLLPVLVNAISDVNDPHVHLAAEAIYSMSLVHRFRMMEAAGGLDDEAIQELEKIAHYPIPSSYEPMKAALANVLSSSKNDNARYWAAMALANGFQPAREIEGIYVRQLPLEEENWRVQYGIISGLSALGDGIKFSPSTVPAIIDSLQSSNIKTQQLAARLIGQHQVAGGLDALIENIPSARDEINFSTILHAIGSFESVNESHIAELERIAAETSEDARKRKILATIDTLRNVNTRQR